MSILDLFQRRFTTKSAIEFDSLCIFAQDLLPQVWIIQETCGQSRLEVMVLPNGKVIVAHDVKWSG